MARSHDRAVHDRLSEDRVVVALRPVAEDGPAAQLWVIAVGQLEVICRADHLCPLADAARAAEGGA